MYRPAARIFVVVLAALMAAPLCAQNHPRTDALPPIGSVTPVEVPSPEQVFAIPPAMRAMLQAQVIDRSSSREQRLQALVEMIFGRQGWTCSTTRTRPTPWTKSGSSAAPTASPSR